MSRSHQDIPDQEDQNSSRLLLSADDLNDITEELARDEQAQNADMDRFMSDAAPTSIPPFNYDENTDTDDSRSQSSDDYDPFDIDEDDEFYYDEPEPENHNMEDNDPATPPAQLEDSERAHRFILTTSLRRFLSARAVNRFFQRAIEESRAPDQPIPEFTDEQTQSAAISHWFKITPQFSASYKSDLATMNGAQKAILEAWYEGFDIQSLSQHDQLKFLSALKSDHIDNDLQNWLKENNLWETTKQFRHVFVHPSPQNRTEGQNGLGQEAGTAIWYDNNHHPQRESLGLLSLSARNSPGIEITKNAVCYYISDLVLQSICSITQPKAPKPELKRTHSSSELLELANDSTWADDNKRHCRQHLSKSHDLSR